MIQALVQKATSTAKPCSNRSERPVRNGNPSGRIDMRHRWYDAQLGRFISPDPIKWKGGTNLYAYSRSNPTTYIDPDGLMIAILAWQQYCGEWAIAESFKLHTPPGDIQKGNRYQHCVINCLHNRCTGLFQTLMTGFLGVMQEVGTIPKFSVGDISANMIGIGNSFRLTEDCRKLCLEDLERCQQVPEEFDEGMLYLLTPNIDPYDKKYDVGGLK